MILLKDISYVTNDNKKILNNINLKIKDGEFIVITGESGSGKSTIASVINGIISHSYDGTLTGKSYIDKHCIQNMELSQIGCHVGSVFQDPRSQFFMMDSFNEVAFGCTNMGLRRDEIITRTEKSLTTFGVEHLREKSVFNISSGEKQKLAIASCYAMQPEIYLFDEPTANLDIQSIFELKTILEKLKKEGKTVIILEHRLFYLPELLDRMIVVSNGEIVGEYTKNTLGELSREKNLRSINLKNLEVKNTTKISLEAKPLLEVKNLSYSHAKTEHTDIIRNISLSAYEREVIGIIGENGVGKTTFAKICTGLLKEKSGSIWIKGKKYSSKERLGKIYFVLQDSDFQLFSNTVSGELDIGRLGEKLTEEEKDDVLLDFNILDLKERHPMTLSRGQKQRVTVATASISSDSRVFFFDEPTSGLDKNSMDLVSKSILKIANNKKVVFVISHDYEFLLSVCNRIICMKNGEVHDDFNLNDKSKEKLWALLCEGR